VSSNLLSERLLAASPMRNPAMIAAFERYELLGIPELDAAWDAVNADFRRWVEASENAARPIQEAPQYWDRIAIGTLQERRTWWE
jgi:hypothetical protein